MIVGMSKWFYDIFNDVVIGAVHCGSLLKMI
jgi:hypothetical protein